MATMSGLVHLVPTSLRTSIEARSRERSSKASRRVKPAKETALLAEPVATKVKTATREDVLNACFVTSAGFAAAGLALRQGSHYLTNLRLFSSDCTALLAYELHPWHIGATLGLVACISALRLGLLTTCPDFARSTQASNERILSSLGPWDCVTIAFSSGVSEELLFRGALLPLVGLDLKGIILGLLLTCLVCSRASFVGVAYGFAAVSTSDLCVPMLAHSSANLVSALYWKYTSPENNL